MSYLDCGIDAAHYEKLAVFPPFADDIAAHLTHGRLHKLLLCVLQAGGGGNERCILSTTIKRKVKVSQDF